MSDLPLNSNQMLLGHGTVPAGYLDARASEADRERAIDVLRAAFAEGRLSGEEHGARVKRAYRSRTYGDLAVLSADLPSGPLGTLPAQAAARSAQPDGTGTRLTSALAVTAAICGLIPILPATLAALGLGIAARRHIRRTGEDGLALANTALALGTFWIVLTLIVLLAVR